ncbi:MAG: hypothetical protein KFH87_10390 [Bacteroidetes bacterium]|nr:hypothetical protein [Bacteroidota bacterium]
MRYYVPDATNDTLNLITPIDTAHFHLPIVSEPYHEGPPCVLVIPVKQHPDQDGWNDNQFSIASSRPRIRMVTLPGRTFRRPGMARSRKSMRMIR